MDQARSGKGRRRGLVTGRDCQLLTLAAEHRLLLPAHAAALLGISRGAAATRLRGLSRDGYLVGQRVLAGQPTCYQATRKGLETVGSALPPPQLDLRAYAHDVGLAWIWLAAHRGTFGPLRQVLSERTLRSHDGRQAALRARAGVGRAPAKEPLGIRLGGVGPAGRERLHYPDLLLVTPQGKRLGVELELTAKGRVRREQILAAYGSDARIAAVLYLVDQPGLARSIRSSARRLGISHLVHVQWVRQPADTAAARGRGAQRASSRRRTALLSPSSPTGAREP